jgi:alpha-beta hydrolase superfamily lysophospholipase
MDPSQKCSPEGARLLWTRRPRSPHGVVLLLHGGQEHSTVPTSWRQGSVLRMLPFAVTLGRRGRGDLAVALCRYAVCGWNEGASPVRDARWALGQVESDYPGLPVALVGYSMGGRVAPSNG